CFFLNIFRGRVSDLSANISCISAHHPLVHIHVIICHTSHCEVLLKNFSAPCPTNIANLASCFHRVVQCSHYKTCYSVFHHLRYRSPVVSDDRSAARHRLDHHQPERLRPINRKQKGVGISQKLVLLLVADFANPFHT